MQENLKQLPNCDFVTYFSTYNLPSFLFVIYFIDCALTIQITLANLPLCTKDLINV